MKCYQCGKVLGAWSYRAGTLPFCKRCIAARDYENIYRCGPKRKFGRGRLRFTIRPWRVRDETTG